ncbi:PhzA/PhzB family protein [Bifidobacterium crudilactis]|uniref:PhzA/PhzB family protein n=1 Tax=Bifidobacterium crudilactis TaxID=327277 RepID=UPI000A012C3E|nr:PhzA/PhzB family protein [Bifidobacterium crudilactis]
MSTAPASGSTGTTGRDDSASPSAEASPSVEEQRIRNREVVERFLHSGHGESLLRRHELFCEDGIAGLWTSDSGEPVFAQGRDDIALYDVWSSEHFPDWQWSNIRIWSTDDVNQFWAECDGGGTLMLPGHEAVPYQNHFIYSFEMRAGRIAREREFMNPITEMKALGMQTPSIELGDFPQGDSPVAESTPDVSIGEASTQDASQTHIAGR